MSTTEMGHLSDADLVRYVDDEAAGHEVHRWDGHIARCQHCADAIETLRSESRLVNDWLERARFEDGNRTGAAPSDPGDRVPGAQAAARRATRRIHPVAPWLKAAAILVLLAGPLAALPQVRAWVAEQVAGDAPEEADAAVEAVAPPADEATILEFTPDAGEFTVRFDAGSRGVLTLERSPDTRAELRARGGAPETVVAPSSLRIRNPEAGRYILRLPATVSGVWVIVGQRAVAVTQDQVERRTAIELDR